MDRSRWSPSARSLANLRGLVGRLSSRREYDRHKSHLVPSDRTRRRLAHRPAGHGVRRGDRPDLAAAASQTGLTTVDGIAARDEPRSLPGQGTGPRRLASANAYSSAISAMMRSVGRYPWLPDVSTRIRVGRGHDCATCRVAANLNEWPGTTRSSWSAVVTSVAG